MNDIVDLIFRDINKLLDEHADLTIKKNFVNKSGEIELVPINLAKGQLMATEAIKGKVASLYKQYKANLNES